VTFKYFYRTWEQLQYLGVLGADIQDIAKEDDLPVIEPYEDSVRDKETRSVSRASDKDTDVFYECSDSAYEETCTTSRRSSPTRGASTRSGGPLQKSKRAVAEARQHIVGVSRQLRAYIRRGAPVAAKEASGEQRNQQTRQQQSDIHTLPKFYRLSVPPSIKLVPAQQNRRPLPSVPHKSGSSSSISYRPHPGYPVEEWRVRTPSPVRSMRNGISTPPLDRHKGRASSFMSAISSTWKHRGPWSSGAHGGADGQSGGRSISR
jgi:hypothetical protein